MKNWMMYLATLVLFAILGYALWRRYNQAKNWINNLGITPNSE